MQPAQGTIWTKCQHHDQSLDISPPDGELLVPQSHVAAHQVVAEGEEAEDVEPVVDGDQDHVLLHHVLPAQPAVAANTELAAVDVHNHGLLGGRVQAPREDVEVQAVL